MNKENCCKVEALISMDDRGQIVLPKDIREKLQLKGGDKLALLAWEKKGQICCISFVKAEELAGSIKDILSPVVEDVFRK